MEADELPVQARLDETFGQPPVTLYFDGHFQIDALFWVKSSTDVHAHGFSGAFAVLRGRSVHTRFQFVERQRSDATFMLGQVSATDAELLDVGDVREIHPGADLIHSVVHLGEPSVTLVARTCADFAPTPEFAYFPPTVALEPSRTSPLRARKIQLIRMLIRARSDILAPAVEDLLCHCDMHTAFMVVRELARHPSAASLVNSALGVCDGRWPGAAQSFGAAVVTDVRHASAVTLLDRVTKPDHRIVLGALAALDDPQLLRTFLQRAVQRATDALITDFVGDLEATGAVAFADGDPFDHLLLRPLAGALARA
jgi:hypothetical protein